jgi:hypothetical protein
MFTLPYTERVIVTSHYKENLEWLKKAPWKVILVDHEGADASWLKPTTIIPNRGREASSYIRYILDNYETLPEHIAFIHGHEDAWHHLNGPILPQIENAKLTPDMYLNLNARMGDHKDMNSIRPDWHMFKKWLGPLPNEPPCAPGCAQFIISKNRILRQPKEFYEALYFHVTHPYRDHYGIGCFYEYIWHYIFGEPWNMCLTENVYSRSRFIKDFTPSIR